MKYLMLIIRIHFRVKRDIKMKKLKVVTVVGTRPEIIRLSRVITRLDKYCDHILVHTGQNFDYELNQVFFDDLEVRQPNYFLDSAISKVIFIGLASLTFPHILLEYLIEKNE